MAKEGSADGAPTEEAGPGRYEERDLNMLESTMQSLPHKTRGLKSMDWEMVSLSKILTKWFKPVNAYRIYV